MEAVQKHKETTAPMDYKPPYLERILPYLKQGEEPRVRVSSFGNLAELDEEKSAKELEAHAKKLRRETHAKRREARRRQRSTMAYMMKGEPMSAQEMRTLFISILRAGYEKQIRDGELEDQQFLAIALNQSLDFAADAVTKGKPLDDWKYVTMFDGRLSFIGNRLRNRTNARRALAGIRGKEVREGVNYTLLRLKVERSLAFMAAHTFAENFFQREFETVDR
jgi:hypothetical protein